jgi:phosphatidate cytidylyltransferase
MSDGAKWDDLAPRIASGAVLAAIGVVCIWLGGRWFAGLAAVTAGLMVWELARMLAPGRGLEAAALGLLTLAAVLVARQAGWLAVMPLVVPAVAGVWILRRETAVWASFALAIPVASWGLALFRDSYGVTWLFWLVCVVIATDVSGYFAGRHFGGRKFWPRVSPKKTWSGTVAGWIAAALVGLVFLLITTAGRDLIWISAAVAFASQMGDIAESAVKRRCGVKDSSNLIPGHGGLWDRFDGLLGASLAMLAVALLVDVPEVRF